MFRLNIHTNTPFGLSLYRAYAIQHSRFISSLHKAQINVHNNTLQLSRFSSTAKPPNNKCANKRCVEVLDLWSDSKVGLLGQTYFMRIFDKDCWDKPEIYYNNENGKKTNDMFIQMVSYICGGDEISGEERELMTATNLLWSAGYIPLNEIEESIQKGCELDEEDATKLAQTLNDIFPSKAMKNYVLYCALTIALSDNVSKPENKRFESVANIMGVDAKELLELFVLEKTLTEKMKSTFDVTKK